MISKDDVRALEAKRKPLLCEMAKVFQLHQKMIDEIGFDTWLQASPAIAELLDEIGKLNEIINPTYTQHA
jgi:hypothetical protein